jgi:hypothetical protein
VRATIKVGSRVRDRFSNRSMANARAKDSSGIGFRARICIRFWSSKTSSAREG